MKTDFFFSSRREKEKKKDRKSTRGKKEKGRRKKVGLNESYNSMKLESLAKKVGKENVGTFYDMKVLNVFEKNSREEEQNSRERKRKKREKKFDGRRKWMQTEKETTIKIKRKRLWKKRIFSECFTFVLKIFSGDSENGNGFNQV